MKNWFIPEPPYRKNEICRECGRKCDNWYTYRQDVEPLKVDKVFNREYPIDTFEHLQDEHICKVLSSCGNSFVEITKKDIEFLGNGGIIYHDDGEYVTVVRLKKE